MGVNIGDPQKWGYSIPPKINTAMDAARRNHMKEYTLQKVKMYKSDVSYNFLLEIVEIDFL